MPEGNISTFQTFPKLSNTICIHTSDLKAAPRIPAAT